MNVRLNRKKLLWVLSGAIDLVGITDLYHGKRVAYIADQLRKNISDFNWSQDDVIKAGLLHDCGVSSTDIHEHLVLEFEWTFVEQHCIRGEKLLNRVGDLSHLAEPIRYHHSSWCSMNGGDIEELANLVFLSDRIDILSKRVDEDILVAKDQVIKTIKSYRGELFKKEYVDAFLELSIRDSFWLRWQESHTDSVMGFWYEDSEKEKIDYIELKELFLLFSSCVDGKSPYTYNHSLGVANLSSCIAILYGLSEDDCKKIELAGLLHDLGKLRVPDRILEKKGSLSEIEKQVMRHHSYDTYNILSPLRSLGDIISWAMQHHEKLNGNGYPDGLGRHELSIYTRIITIADIYQALAQDRPYRDGLDDFKIFEILDNLVMQGDIDSDIVSIIKENEIVCREASKSTYSDISL